MNHSTAIALPARQTWRPGYRPTAALPNIVCSDLQPGAQTARDQRSKSLSSTTEKTPAATILIVDDESQNRKLLETLLRPEG
ncbi:MAG: hypothetical protein ACXWJZ_11395, partial [Burkholderiaceae bacterium]